MTGGVGDLAARMAAAADLARPAVTHLFVAWAAALTASRILRAMKRLVSR